VSRVVASTTKSSEVVDDDDDATAIATKPSKIQRISPSKVAAASSPVEELERGILP
jgi:hypothetical protein